MEFRMPDDYDENRPDRLNGAPHPPQRISCREVKSTARRVLSADLGNTLTVAGVYLLVTLWVRTLFLLFCPMPLTDALNALNEGMERLSAQAAGLTDDALVDACNGVLGEAWGVLRSGLSSFGGLFSTFLLILILLTGLIADYGLQSWSLRTVRGEYAGPEELASRVYLAGKILLLTAICLLVVGIWFWLLLFPAVYVWYRQRAASYLLLDYPELGAPLSWSLSANLLRGYKWRLFLLDLSFLGWVLLAQVVGELPFLVLENAVAANLFSLLLTSGVYLYLVPYRNLAYAKFFDLVKQDSLVTPILEALLKARAERDHSDEEE